jgi:flagellar protein FliL
MSEKEADKDGDEKAAAPKGNGQMKLVIVGAAALFVALVGAQVATPLINRALEGGHEAAAPAEDEEHAAEGEEAAEDEEHAEEAVIEPALYAPLDPPFVVSFDEPDGTRYLQLTLQAMARHEESIAAIKQHAPAIRNAFLFLLSGYKLEQLATLEGKEALRVAMLGSAKEILAKNTGEEQIEDLYFTSLVVQ